MLSLILIYGSFGFFMYLFIKFLRIDFRDDRFFVDFFFEFFSFFRVLFIVFFVGKGKCLLMNVLRLFRNFFFFFFSVFYTIFNFYFVVVGRFFFSVLFLKFVGKSRLNFV